MHIMVISIKNIKRENESADSLTISSLEKINIMAASRVPNPLIDIGIRAITVAMVTAIII